MQDPQSALFVFFPSYLSGGSGVIKSGEQSAILLFSSDRVCRFFSHKLNMTDWSYMATYNPGRNSILNVGQNFAVKYWLNDEQDIGLFYHFGTHGELGLSFRRPGGDCVSFGAGLTANNLVDTSEKHDLRTLTVDLVATAGMFYDRNGSLMASLLYSKSQDYKLRLNIYPGVFKVLNLSPGVFLSLDQDDRVSAGVTVNFIPFGLSHTF